MLEIPTVEHIYRGSALLYRNPASGFVVFDIHQRLSWRKKFRLTLVGAQYGQWGSYPADNRPTEFGIQARSSRDPS